MATTSMIELKNILEKKFRKYFPKRIPKYRFYINKLKGLSGIELGGPSLAFTKQGFLPIYQHIESLDGCNFSSNTIWEGQIEAGRTYHYENKVGHQYILDGSALTEIKDEQYDFLLSCHNLEHIANPIKALKEWRRVLKPHGYLLMILPHKDKTFDHKRPITTLDHILADYQHETPETDSTHFEEVLKYHDITRDAGVETQQDLVERTAKNIENRCVHHHVFNSALAAQIVDHVGFKIINLTPFSPCHIIVLAQKNENKTNDNEIYTTPSLGGYAKSCFPSDRKD
jgi:SAM-dependent methyltransferase